MQVHGPVTGTRITVLAGRASLRTQVAVAGLAVMLYLVCLVFKMT